MNVLSYKTAVNSDYEFFSERRNNSLNWQYKF